MFLYCDLVQNETLVGTQTALLRSFPPDSLSSTNQYRREVSHRSFSNLQWKRIYKSQFQSITLTLANEMGQRLPFLSFGRTSITLALRPKPPWTVLRRRSDYQRGCNTTLTKIGSHLIVIQKTISELNSCSKKFLFQTQRKSPTSPHHHHHHPCISIPSVMLNLKV